MRATNETNGEAGEVPGVRWVTAAHEHWRRFEAHANLAETRGLFARHAAAPIMASLRKRVDAARGRMNQPGRPAALLPQPPTEQSSSPPNGRQETPDGRGLDPALQRRIERLLSMEIPALRVHTGSVADQLARRHNADAVTMQRDVYFRQGEFNPSTPKGIGLLAHEATHVAWNAGARPAASFRPAADVEEATALAVERRVVRGEPASSLPPLHSAVMPSAPAHPGSVKTALTSRDLTQSEAPSPTPQLSEPQVRALKDDIYCTLLDKLRSDFERGA